MKNIWFETSSVPKFPALSRDLDCDACVVGGGIAGITTAYLLLQQGLSVVLIEDGEIGSSETGHTSAHLSNALDTRYHALEEIHGQDKVHLAAESHTAAISWIERTVGQEKIDCNFQRVNGYLFAPPGESIMVLEKEWGAARRAGLAVAGAPRAPWKSYDTGRCLFFPRQAQFHPLKYLSGLAARIAQLGGQIYTNTHASRIIGGENAQVLVQGGQVISAKYIVVTTNVPINDKVVMHTKQASYRSYVIAARIPNGAVAHALYWDTADPYHYVRVAKGTPEMEGDECLIIGGEDHKTGQGDQGKDSERPHKALETWARERFPEMKEILYRWSGQIIEPMDGLAFIGRNPLDKSNVFISSGSSGNGLTYGTVAGLLITDLIMKRKNPWEALYDPSRKTAAAAAEFAKENLNVLPQYLDWLTPGGVQTVQEIKPDSGAVVREGIKKVAVYRDPQGEIHAFSAVCPHLGCLVDWNSNEKTWDCPCHGSRFSSEGQVINGPANVDLKPLEEKPAQEEKKESTRRRKSKTV